MPVYPAAPTVVIAPSLLAVTAYDSGSDVGPTSVSTAADGTDFDATNLNVSFIVPLSGSILIRFSASLSMAGGTNGYWIVREGSLKVKEAIVKDSAGIVPGSKTFRISGLTPGTIKTYKWGARVSSGTTTLYYGPSFGPAVMEVWDANPTYSQQILTGVRPFKVATRTAGGVTVSSTTFAVVDSALDLTIAAQIGDVLAVEVSAMWDSGAAWSAMDAVTRVASADVNYISGGTSSSNGVAGWFTAGGSLISTSGVYFYTVVAGDISAGMCTVRLVARVPSTTRSVRGTAGDCPLQFSVRNLGQAAA